MAATPTLVHHKSSASQAGDNGTVYHFNFQNSLANNRLILKVEGNAPTADPAISDNKGNTWEKITSVNGGKRMAVFTAANVAAGTNQIICDWTTNGAMNQTQFHYSEWANTSTALIATAVDGSVATGLVAGSPCTLANITTTADGDLLLQWGSNNQNIDNACVFTKGTGWTLLATQIHGASSGQGFDFLETAVAQYQIQGTHGAVTPSYSYTGAANSSDSIAIAIKASATASGTLRPAGIQVVGVHQFYLNGNAASQNFQFPHIGNMIHLSICSENAISSITDGDSNTYQTAAAGADRIGDPAGAIFMESWRALNTAANSDLRTGVINMTVVLTTNKGYVSMYDIIGADTVQGTGGRVQTVTANGTDNVVENLTTVTITPQNQNALIICPGEVTAATIQALVTPSSANGGSTDVDPYTGQDGVAGLNNDDMSSHWYNGTSVAATTFVWSHQGVAAFGNWSALATEYKAAATDVLSAQAAL